MKNINYIINGVLAVAVIILFVMQFSGKKETSSTTALAMSDEPVSVLPIAYVDIDSLLTNYNYAKDLYEIQVQKTENARLNLNQQLRELEKDINKFQRELESNAFLTQERIQSEQQRLGKKQQDLQALDERTAYELAVEQQRTSEILRDTIVSQLRVFNETRGYQMILSNTGGDNILIADDAYNITGELIELLNKNYSK